MSGWRQRAFGGVAWLLAAGVVLSGGGPVQALAAAKTVVKSVSKAAPRLAELTPEQVDQAAAALREASRHGLPASVFDPDKVVDAAKSDDAAVRTRGQAALRHLLVAYARAQHGLRVPPKDFDKAWGLKPGRYDASGELDAALAGGGFANWLASLPPPFPGYAALEAGYARYRSIAEAGGWKPVSAGPAFQMGMTGPRVASLVARLAVEDAAAKAIPPGSPYDQTVADAVSRFQERMGLPKTGLAASATLAALDVPIATRLRQIALNMERWRWVPRDRPSTRLDVNIAAATLDGFADGKPTIHMLAAAGRDEEDDRTPILGATITSIVLNPPWNVPDGIATKELFPKQRRDHGYFEREGFRVRKPGEGTRLVQDPGPKNALGQIKFDFDNPYGVYLHDTPAKSAFARSSRSVSHGCVRLERPDELAKLLLAGAPDWPADKIDATVGSDDTVRVPVPVPMPVFLLYWTAFPAGDAVAFRRDVYGWDAKLSKLLAQWERTARD